MTSKSGPLIIIEDDLDDQEIIKEILISFGIPDTLLFFTDGTEALIYLQTTSDQPFLILCDINLPKMNGLEFRNEIHSDDRLRKKCIPFVFFSTNANKDTVVKAYDLTVQGFFTKSATLDELQNTLSMIINYWTHCRHPNNY